MTTAPNEITHSILRALLFCISPEGHWGLPGLAWGSPGTGKTAMIKAIADQLGLPFMRMSPAEQGEARFGVVPVPGADGYLHYPPPADVVQHFGTGRGLLFVDELNTAPPSIQAPLLGLVQLRTLGSYIMPNGVRVIGAANETRDAAGGWDLAPALANRFGHYDVSGLSPEDWSLALLSGFAPSAADHATAADLEAEVVRLWPSAEANARGLISGFITRRSDALYKRPARGGGERAWPSHRTVTYAATALASAKVHGLSESDTDTLLSGFVGRGWVSEFRTWSEHADLPNPADLLDGNVKFVHDERRPDRTLAVLGACAALVVPATAQRREARGLAFWRLVGSIAKDVPDYVVQPARAALRAGLQMQKNADYVRIMGDLLPMLNAAGIGK
jgi:MoxR-like ATPase